MRASTAMCWCWCGAGARLVRAEKGSASAKLFPTLHGSGGVALVTRFRWSGCGFNDVVFAVWPWGRGSTGMAHGVPLKAWLWRSPDNLDLVLCP